MTCRTVDEILQSNIDIVIADFSVTVERLDVIDFSIPIATEGLTIFMRTPKAMDVNLFSFLLPYSSTVWISLLAALIIGKNNVTNSPLIQYKMLFCQFLCVWF